MPPTVPNPSDHLAIAVLILQVLLVPVVPLLLLTQCGGGDPPPPDFTPIGEGLRFLGVCGVLTMVVFSLARLVHTLRE